MKADLARRFVALLIDAILAAIVALIPFIGGFIAAAYMLLRDGFDFEFMKGRSLGKVAMNLKPVIIDGEKDVDLTTSVKRNWTLCVGYIFTWFPIINFIFWICAVVLFIIEIILVFTDPEGRRLGDKIAGTKVIEFKK